ncbi:MAG: gamma-glutamyl-gamma-aminobutyrate hydrolase family protein [Myxococcota bacterium]
MRARVGIPLCLDAGGRWREGREYLYADWGYAAAVAEARGTPLHLPIQNETAALLDTIDGLLIPGGDDLPPPGRGETDGLCLVSAAQLEFDRQLLAGALERGLPLLGICYGLQLLAHALGGALLYDLQRERPEGGPHALGEHELHPLEVVAGTHLARIVGPGATRVNSLHHQGVADPGPELRVAARADDGLIEALEHPERKFCLGVQWHPEKLGTSHRHALFSAFIAACSDHRDG